MNDSRADDFLKLEKLFLRCLLVSFAILIVWALGLFVADEFIVSVHAKFLGVADADLPRFGYDAKLIHYQFLGYFKLGAALLFFIPWLVLRLSRNPD